MNKFCIETFNSICTSDCDTCNYIGEQGLGLYNEVCISLTPFPEHICPLLPTGQGDTPLNEETARQR